MGLRELGPQLVVGLRELGPQLVGVLAGPSGRLHVELQQLVVIGTDFLAEPLDGAGLMPHQRQHGHDDRGHLQHIR